MQFVLPIIALLILGVAELSISNTPPPSPKKDIKDDIRKEKTEIPTPTLQEKLQINKAVIITPTPTYESTKPKTVSSLIYPNARITTESEHGYSLESTDSAEQITDWYKSYIQNNQMNATSFVTTNTNDTVLNKLAGAGNGKEITVEISRQASEAITKIKITF